jgi:hypothetical protein
MDCRSVSPVCICALLVGCIEKGGGAYSNSNVSPFVLGMVQSGRNERGQILSALERL